MTEQLRLIEVERSAYWCPRDCKNPNCGPGTCVCKPCYCDRCRLRAQIAATSRVPRIDLPATAIQPRLFPNPRHR